MLTQKPLPEITRSDIEALLANQTPESRALDYKRDLNLASDDDRKELARDVSSFANAGGGDLVYGIDEKGGTPMTLLGVACPDFDATKRRIDSIVQDLIDPRVPGIEIEKVDGFPNGPIVLVRVPRSWVGPHMLSYKNQTHFFSRNNAGRQPLDVREIGHAFRETAARGEQIRNFRTERIGRIVASDIPIVLRERSRLILHVVPLTAVDVDVQALRQKDGNGSLKAFSTVGGWEYQFNLDGLIAFSGARTGPQSSYTLAFRNGAIEGVGVYPVNEGAIYPFAVEKLVHRATVDYTNVLIGLGCAGPIALMLTLTGVAGKKVDFGLDYQPLHGGLPGVDRDILDLPEILLKSPDTDLKAALRPVFDALAQSGGHARSFGYDDKGVWIEQAHR